MKFRFEIICGNSYYSTSKFHILPIFTLMFHPKKGDEIYIGWLIFTLIITIPN